MPKARRKLPKGIHVHESGSVYICYKNEHGKIIRENTHQTDIKAAELMLAQARTDVAMKRRFASLTFESVKFIDLFNEWWSNHGSRTRSKFQYRTPRVIGRFKNLEAREITPDSVRAFLADLRTEGLAASSINQCRTILCSVFNYAIRFEKYDKNPVSVVPQEREPPGRHRFPEPEEIVEMIRVCEEKGDLELKAFLVLAPTTGMRKGEILARKWSDIDIDSANPCIYVRQTKNDEPKRIARDGRRSPPRSSELWPPRVRFSGKAQPAVLRAGRPRPANDCMGIFGESMYLGQNKRLAFAPVTSEVAGSSPVVPAIPFNHLRLLLGLGICLSWAP
jgi:Phage integrase family/Phage integrase SAM-like domain